MNAKTFPVTSNSQGFFAYHTQDGQPFTPEAVTSMINGPLAATQEKLSEVLDVPTRHEQIVLCE
jgi:hypothetical protein